MSTKQYILIELYSGKTTAMTEAKANSGEWIAEDYATKKPGSNRTWLYEEHIVVEVDTVAV